MPPSYWVEALSTATVLINILLTKTLGFSTPHNALFGTSPAYGHLRVFGCKCIPTCLPQPPTNSPLAPPCASSWAIPLTIKDNAALTSLPTESLFLGMSSSMKLPFLSLSAMAPGLPRSLSFLMLLMLCQPPLGRCTQFCLQVFLLALLLSLP